MAGELNGEAVVVGSNSKDGTVQVPSSKCRPCSNMLALITSPTVQVRCVGPDFAKGGALAVVLTSVLTSVFADVLGLA